MKKLYTVAMAAVVTVTASAITRQQEAVTSVNRLQVTAEPIGIHGDAKVPAKASTFNSVSEMEGELLWDFFSLIYPSGYSSKEVDLTVVDAETGLVNIDGIYPVGLGLNSLEATVDLAAGTLTITNRQFLGEDVYGAMDWFYFKGLNDEGALIPGALDVESVVATLDGNTFKFPDNVIIAVGDPDNEKLGWWTITAFNKLTKNIVNPDPDPESWTAFSSATMIDGWIMPALTYNDGSYANPEDFPITVSVERNDADPNLIRLVNPYLKSSGFPLDGSDGYIVIDIADPEFVIVKPGVFSGFINGSDDVYCFNVEGFCESFGMTQEEIKEEWNVIEEWSNMTEEGTNTIISIPTCRFNYPTALDKMYTWTNRADAMKATISIEGTVGIDNVIVANEDANAPVEYYTVHGVRVDNPQAGSIVIRRQGSQVSKVIVK